MLFFPFHIFVYLSYLSIKKISEYKITTLQLQGFLKICKHMKKKLGTARNFSM